MNVVHEQVKHRQFGIGAVVKQTDTIVEVKFDKEFGNKRFIYPAAFERFLELCDPSSQNKLNDELLELHEQIEARRRLSEEEIKQHLDETRQALIKQRRAAAKKGTTAKKKATVKKADILDVEEPEESDSDVETEA